MRNVVSERMRGRMGLISVIVALALPACSAASAGTRDGSDAPTRSTLGDAGTIGCADVPSVRHAATAPGDGRPSASEPGSGAAIRKVATPAGAAAVASVSALGAGRPVPVRDGAKTAFGGMRATGAASAGNAGPCG